MTDVSRTATTMSEWKEEISKAETEMIIIWGGRSRSYETAGRRGNDMRANRRAHPRQHQSENKSRHRLCLISNRREFRGRGEG